MPPMLRQAARRCLRAATARGGPAAVAGRGQQGWSAGAAYSQAGALGERAAALDAALRRRNLLSLRNLRTVGLFTCLGSATAAQILALEKPVIAEPHDGGQVSLPIVPLAELLPRALQLLALFTPLSLLSLPAMYIGELRNIWYRLLVWTLEQAGCAFIKWGQWAATRPDLFPPKMCSALSSLQSGVPPHSWRDTERIVSDALGVPLRDAFAEFIQEPLGSGSVAQVHRARLHGEKQFVAVKVRHPRVVERMRTDFAILAAVGALLDALPSLHWLGAHESLRQFAHAMSSQVRLDVEAANLARFCKNFRSSPHISATFPAPRPRLVSPAVIVESYEPGRSIMACVDLADAAAEAARMEAAGTARVDPWSDPARPPLAAALPLSSQAARHVVNTGKEAYLQMLLVDNFVHADLHPGNILLKEEPGRPPVLVLVDAGMVEVLTPREQENFVGLFRAMGKGDGREAAARLLGFSEHQPGTPEQQAAFAAKMESLFQERCQGFRKGVQVGPVLREMLATVREFHVRVDARYATAVVNLLCIESFASKLDPQYNLLDGSEALLRAHEVLGQRALASLLPLVSPALAMYRAARELVTWRLAAAMAPEGEYIV